MDLNDKSIIKKQSHWTKIEVNKEISRIDYLKKW